MGEVTIETIEADIKAVEEATDLEDNQKTDLKDQLGKAKSELEMAAAAKKQAAQFKADIENAANDIQQATKQKDSVQKYDFQRAASLDLNALNKDRSDLEQQVNDAKKALAEALAEPQRRVARMAEIAKELSSAKESLAAVDEKLKATDISGDPSLTLLAKYRLLRATRNALAAKTDSLTLERSAYEAQGELPRLQIDVATARLKQLEEDYLKLVEISTERRKTDAQAQRELAVQALDNAPAILKPFAKSVVDKVNQRSDLATEIQRSAEKRDRTNKQLARWKEEFDRTRKRTEAVGSDTVGAMLVERRSELPSVTVLQEQIDGQGAKLREYQFDLYELEDRRVDLSDVDAAVETAVKQLKDDGKTVAPEITAQLRELLKLELLVLDSLLIDANRNYQIKIDSRDDQQELANELLNYRSYIDQKVFWVRSAPTLRLSHLGDSKEALDWLFNRSVLEGMREQMKTRFLRHPVQFVVATFAIIFLFIIRPRLRKLLRECGEIASPISCEVIRPTFRAIWITLLLAASVSLAIWGISEILSGAQSEPVRAIAYALSITALWLFSFEFMWQLWRSGGLADAHFGWPQEAAPAVKRFARSLLALGTPLIFFGTVFQRNGDPIFLASLGRISMILLLLLTAFCAYRILRPESQFLTERLFGRRAETIRGFLLPMIILVPLALAVMAANGFQYAAHQLTVNLLLTFSLLIGLSVLRALLFRWVRITRRWLRKQQLLESRERTAESEESATGDIDALAAKEADVDLVEMDRQTRRLITLAIFILGIFGVWSVWVDVAKAADPILDYTVYSIEVAKDVSEPITIGAILFAVLTVVLTVAAWRNLPGLVDVFLLGRIEVESSIRYAVTTLLQYAIAIAGAIIAMGALGFSWGRMQWLVAAMGVGLGFGLQEVVANFVSGIILLFERPIRVGDIVTLGDTTGVVIRIRSRATTVRNWDRQEVVIPNKELITGRITNWTLTDQLNRIVIDVGVAYGTDTDHTRDLLHEILVDNPNVLDDPRPLVTFEQFGDSTLNFIVRAYLENLDERLKTIHDLHTTIHQRFNEEKIEIAFPQRDLHLRSVDQSAKLLDQDRQTAWPDVEVESSG